MLKKLIKYGNSNALVLDKTLMSLLELKEDSLVKLRVEGNKLTICASNNIDPVEQLKTEILAPYEVDNDAFDLDKKFMEKYIQEIATKETKENLPGGENYEKNKAAFKNFFEKKENKNDIANLMNYKEYLEKARKVSKEMQQKYLDNEITAKEYQKIYAEKIAEINKDFPEAEKLAEGVKKTAENCTKQDN